VLAASHARVAVISRQDLVGDLVELGRIVTGEASGQESW
jgi:hypothetical protein